MIFFFLFLTHSFVVIPPAQEPVMAWITAYSCQGRECINSLGKRPAWRTVACGRGIRLGTHILISGIGEFVCEDRYNRRLDKLRGLQTVDIFAGEGKEAERQAKIFGRQRLPIKVL